MSRTQRKAIWLGHIAYSSRIIFISLISLPAVAQSTATLRGTVTLGDSGKPVHNVLITILQLKRTVDTDDDGKYEFQNVPPGKYDVVAHLDRVPDIVRTVDLTGGDATVDFQIELTGVREAGNGHRNRFRASGLQFDSISRCSRFDRTRKEESGVTR